MSGYVGVKTSTPQPIAPLQIQTQNNNPCCDCERTLFQTLLQPDGSGQLPANEGVVEFTQTISSAGNKLGQAIWCASGFFLVVSGISVCPPGSNASLWLYPVLYNLAFAAPDVSSPIGNDPGYEVVAANNGNGFALNPFTVGPSLKLVPRNEQGAQSSRVTIRALQLRDCPNNWHIR